MKTIQINEKSLLISLSQRDSLFYFPKGDFDIADKNSRIMLRQMISDAGRTCGRDLSGRLKLDVFGKSNIGFSIFCTKENTDKN